MIENSCETVFFIYYSERSADLFGTVLYKDPESGRILEGTECSSKEIDLSPDRKGWKDLVFVGKGVYWKKGTKGKAGFSSTYKIRPEDLMD